jgi:hypothetical protein
VSVFFTNTSATTALHSMNPSPHINNDPSTLSNELNDLIDAHLTTLTQEHAAVFDPSHPHSLLLRVLRYTNNSQNTSNYNYITSDNTLLTNNSSSINSLATLHPTTLTPTPTPTLTPTPTPTPTSAPPTHPLGDNDTFATQSGKVAHAASSTPGTSAVSKSKASLTNLKA